MTPLDAIREMVRTQAKPMRTTTVKPWYRRRVVGALARRSASSKRLPNRGCALSVLVATHATPLLASLEQITTNTSLALASAN